VAQVNASPTTSLILSLRDADATDALGAAIAPALQPGMVIFLSGQLGAGKTSLARAMLRALGYEGRVKSPTYTLVELYTISRLNFYHFDFYRFHDPHEWVEAGFRDLFNETSVCLVEWPEKAGGLLPAADLVIHLGISGSGREATLTATSEKGQQCIRAAEAHGGGTSEP
jgi:tRNA threonylcarbamoyladenosine biosynthesis protein TsaE